MYGLLEAYVKRCSLAERALPFDQNQNTKTCFIWSQHQQELLDAGPNWEFTEHTLNVWGHGARSCELLVPCPGIVGEQEDRHGLGSFEGNAASTLQHPSIRSLAHNFGSDCNYMINLHWIEFAIFCWLLVVGCSLLFVVCWMIQWFTSWPVRGVHCLHRVFEAKVFQLARLRSSTAPRRFENVSCKTARI